MKRKTTVVFSCLFIAMLIYFAGLSILGDPRASDGTVTGEDMHWLEITILISGMGSALISSLLAINSAAHYRQFKWFFLLCLFFPMAFVYHWKFPNDHTPMSGLD